MHQIRRSPALLICKAFYMISYSHDLSRRGERCGIFRLRIEQPEVNDVVVVRLWLPFGVASPNMSLKTTAATRVHRRLTSVRRRSLLGGAFPAARKAFGL